MHLKIVQIGHPVLRKQARELSREEIRSQPIQQLIEWMRETMRDAPGVGLAAPQIGESLQIAVIEDRADYLEGVPDEVLAERQRVPVPFHVLINPKLTVRSAESVDFFEGCLSMHGFSAIVPRARAVRVQALNERAEPVTIDAEGWYARILQHETDHLFGTVYIDKMRTRTLACEDSFARYMAGRPVSEILRELERR